MNLKRNRRAFTLVELMAVVAILGVLIGIITSAAANSVRLSREQKAKAICVCAQQGVETYRAQKDRWPGPLGSTIESGGVPQRANHLGPDYSTDPDKFEFDSSEIRDTIRTLVEETVRNGNPMLDISGLYVCRHAGYRDSSDYGMDFRDAVRGTKKSPRKMSVSEMYYGYPEASSGRFRHFWIVYSLPTDTMTVSMLPSDSRRQMQR